MDAKTKTMVVPLIAGLVIGFLIGMALSGGILGEWSRFTRFTQPKSLDTAITTGPTGPGSWYECRYKGVPGNCDMQCKRGGLLSCEQYHEDPVTGGYLPNNIGESMTCCYCIWGNTATCPSSTAPTTGSSSGKTSRTGASSSAK